MIVITALAQGGTFCESPDQLRHRWMPTASNLSNKRYQRGAWLTLPVLPIELGSVTQLSCQAWLSRTRFTEGRIFAQRRDDTDVISGGRANI